jgi:hypothetical protein
MSNKTRRAVLRRKTNQARRLWLLALIGDGALLVGLVVFAVWQAVGGNSAPKVPVEVKSAPSLKADKEKVDLGNVRLGQTVEVTFNIANVGDRQLRFIETPYVEVIEGC